MDDIKYGIGVPVPLGYDAAAARTTAPLKAEGFGVLTTIDVRETLKQNFGVDRRPLTSVETMPR
jgi:uncharacterized protein (DUF302 family)